MRKFILKKNHFIMMIIYAILLSFILMINFENSSKKIMCIMILTILFLVVLFRNNILSVIYSNDKRKSLIIKSIIFLIVFFSIFFIKLPSNNLILEIKYGEKEPTTTQQLYFDTGNEFSEEKSIKSENGQFYIDKTYLSSVGLRLDISSTEEDVQIEYIKLINNNQEILRLRKKQLIDNLIAKNDIESIELNNEYVNVNTSGVDSQIIFSDYFMKIYNDSEKKSMNIFRSKLLLCYLILFIICISISMNSFKKANEFINKKIINFRRFEKIFIVLIIIGIPVVLYWKYITYSKLYIFNDIAQDSYTQTFPNIVNNTKYIYQNGTIPMWSFESGLGQNIYTQYMDPFNLLISIFGERFIPYLLGLFQCIKVILAGGIFYKYLKTMDYSKYVSILGAILYAYCGHMITRGAWVSYPNEVVCVAFLLLSFELFYKKNKKIWLPIAIAFLIISLKGYYFFLYTGIFIAYSIFRYTCDNEFYIKKFIKFLGEISILYFIGTLMSMIYLLPSLILNLSGARATNVNLKFNDLIKNIFSINDINILISEYARTVSQTLLGIEDYSGVYNLLEGPLFYCGLLTLILIPQVFYKLDKKRKAWFFIALAICISYMLSPGIRFMAGGFSSSQFKISSFWVVVVFLYLSSYALNEIIKGKQINKKLLLITVGILLAPLIIIYFTENNCFKLKPMIEILIFTAAYTLFFMLWNNKFLLSKVAILAIVIIEAITMSYPLINNRGTVSKEQLFTKGYYDSKLEIINNIKYNDKNEFYRISTNYNSASFCDSLIQQYYGTKAYQGGSTNSKYIIDFIDEFNAPLYGSDSVILGFSGYTELNSILGVKYILSKSEDISEYGYDKIGQYNDVSIFKNKYNLPLGYTYDSYILYDEYKNLTTEEKKQFLLNNCVLNKDSENLESHNFNYQNINAQRNRILMNLEKYNNNEDIIINLNSDEDSIIVDFYSYKDKKLNSEKLKGKIYWETKDTKFNEDNMITFGINGNNSNSSFVINQKNIERMKIVLDDPNNIEIRDLKIYSTKAEEYYKQYINGIQKLRESSLEITAFEENNIKGNINVKGNKMLFFSIPYDKGWSLKVDGEPTKLENVNIGFMGAEITDGYHEIELSYMSPGLKVGILLTIIGLILYIVAIVIERKSKAKEII